jgi:predicted kinase
MRHPAASALSKEPTTVEKRALIITCGLPRSGKTTWSKKMRLPVVNPDAIRMALGCYPFNRGRENEVWETASTIVKHHFHYGHEVVIVDATSLSTQARWNWKNVANSVGARLVAVPFKTDVETCVKRAKLVKDDNTKQLIAVIKSMNETAVWPTKGEGLDVVEADAALTYFGRLVVDAVGRAQ